MTADSGEARVNTAQLYDYQGTIVVDDYNFDGREDLAAQTGQDGPYGGPTFSIFLQTDGRAVCWGRNAAGEAVAP